MKYFVALAALAALPSAAMAQPATLDLVCNGTGIIVSRDNNGTLGDVLDDSITKSETKAMVRFRLSGDVAEVKLPGTLPGGGDKWQRLQDLSVSAEAIRGRFQLGMLDRVRVSIDRRSGDMEVSGATTFSGACERAPADTGAPKF